MKFVFLAFLAVCLFLFATCSNNVAGNKTKPENPSVTTMLYNPGGSPAAHAKIKFYPVNYNPRTGGLSKTLSTTVDSTTTDASGNYSVKLDSGTYNVLATGDSGVVYQDSISVAKDSTIHPPADTLKAPGGLRGRVRLQPGDDARTVFILFLGTSTFGTPDDSTGKFTIANMAQGTYKVRILTTLDAYVPKDTVLSVTAGMVDSLTHDIVLQFTGVPGPTGLTVSYDTLRQTAILAWTGADTSLIAGYNVYRAIKGQNFSLITQTPLVETVSTYHDSTVSVGSTYAYRVVSWRASGEESPKVDIPGDTVKVVSDSLVTTAFTWNLNNTINDSASINDTIKACLTYSNPTRRIEKIVWFVDSLNSTAVRQKADSSQAEKDTLTYSWKQAGNVKIFVKVTDGAGTVWLDSFNVTIAQDIPVPNAGSDTTVSIKDMVRLHGSATQQFGSIVEWAWDIGNTGTFKVTSRGDTNIIAPAAENLNYLCVLRVTDDDANIAKDTVKITVLQDAPVADAGNDTTVAINASIPFKGTATQQFGRIVMYKWDFDGNGTYDDSSTTTGIANHTYTHDTVYNAKLLVRDDDGNEATAIRHVTVANLPPVISSIRADTTISIKDSIQLFGVAHDPDGTIKEYAWDFNGDGAFEYTSATQVMAGYRYNTAGIYKAVLRVTDDDNKVTKDTATIAVLQDVPVPNAGKDTTVSIKDTIKLHGSATQQFGTIVEWAWDFGNTGTFKVTSKGDTNIVAPAVENLNYLCVLRAKDDDGNVANDTVKITVLQDAPVPNAGVDTTVAINANVPFKGTATQQFGTIVMYKWDFDGDGNYDDSSTTTGAATHIYTHEAVYNAKLLVRDNDGNEATAIRHVTVANLPPVISSIRADTTISIKDSIQLFGVAHDPDGTIKEYAWDFNGDGAFEYTSATQVMAGYRYNTAGTYKAVLRVTDDDNKVTKDTAIITILQDVPVVTFLSADTVVDHGGTVRCSVYVQQQFGTMTIEIDTANSGNYKGLGSLGLSGGKAYSFTTGNASSWDSVKVRITDDDGNVVIRGFKIDIRPQPLTITSIDSTVNTITVHYGQSQETDFAQYRIYRNTTSAVDTNSELWTTISASGTVTYSTPTPSYAWNPRYYRVYQKDNEGVWSTGSNVVYGNIINSPPTIPTISFPLLDGDSIWSFDKLRWHPSVDPNGNTVRYKVLINYNSTSYSQFATALTDTLVQLTGCDSSLSLKFKVMSYDALGDSSAWSAERIVFIRPITDIDGNVYYAVTIGAQVWMVENLKTTRYNDGTAIPLATDDAAWGNASTTPAYCWYQNNINYKEPYGALYNAVSVNSGKLAPTGWHVPTNSEWSVLNAYLSGNGLQGGALKEAGTTHWVFPNTGATNETGFSALPGGRRASNGAFDYIGYDGSWWTSTAFNVVFSYYWYMDYLISDMGSSSNSINCGNSIRCVRDP